MSALVPTDEVRVTSQDRLLQQIQSRWPGYHPVLAMVEIAKEQIGAEADQALAFACHKEVAKYVVAVDRVSEIKADVKKTRRVVVELFAAPDQLPPEVSRPPVLAAPVVEDVVETRTIVQTRGPVEEPESLQPVTELFAQRRHGLATYEDTETISMTARMG